MAKERLKNLAKYAMKVSLTEEHAKNILARKDIGLVTLKNEQGRIYGVYIIDHKYKMVLKASDISHEIAANQWIEQDREKQAADKAEDVNQSIDEEQTDKETKVVYEERDEEEVEVSIELMRGMAATKVLRLDQVEAI